MEYGLVRKSVPIRAILAFVERAGTAPLDIHISERHEGWFKEHMYVNNLNSGLEGTHSFTAAMMEDVKDRILPKIRTIRTLVIIVDPWGCALVVLDKLRDSYYVPEQMERFGLHQTGRRRLWAGPMPESRNLSRPIPFYNHRLTYICFNGLHIRRSAPQMSNL